MKYIVVGGAGFIGSNLVDYLITKNHEVLIVDNFSTGKKENINPKATVYNMDISNVNNSAELVDLMTNADSVFLLAAKVRVQSSIVNPMDYEQNNTIGVLNILRCAAEAGIRRVVYSASAAAYGDSKVIPLKETLPANPLSPYGAQKYYGEVLCRMFAQVYNIETVSLRYFNVYGEKQNIGGAYASVMGIFAHQRLNGKPMTIRGDGEQKRDFTYVGDIVNANVLASQSEQVGKGEVINIGNGDNRSINKIADMIGGDRINVEPVIEPKESLADNSLAKELLGWEPTQIIEDWIPMYKKDLGLN